MTTRNGKTGKRTVVGVGLGGLLLGLLAVWAVGVLTGGGNGGLGGGGVGGSGRSSLLAWHNSPAGRFLADVRTGWSMVKFLVDPEFPRARQGERTGLAVSTDPGINQGTHEHSRPDSMGGAPARATGSGTTS